MLANCNCLTSAPRGGQPNELVVTHMRTSPSHDERGDAPYASAATDIKAFASFTDSGGGSSQAAGELQAGGDINSLFHDNLKDQQLRAANAGRSAQASDVAPLFNPSIQGNASNRLDAAAGQKLQTQPQQQQQHQKQQQQQQQQQKQQQQQQQRQQQQQQQQQRQQPQQSLPQPQQSQQPPPLQQQQDREQQQQQPQPKQQHLPLATEESEEGFVESDGDDSISVIDVQVGYPGGLGRKTKNETKAGGGGGAVNGQSKVDPDRIKNSFYWAFNHGNKERKPTYGNRDHRQASLIQSFSRRFPFLSHFFLGHSPSSGRFVPVLYPAFRYQQHMFGIRVFFVQTPELRNQCLLFCRQTRSLSIDTEAAPLQSKIDLLQIGDDNEVYLCPLRDQDPGFLNAVADAIFQDARKTVYQFGSDDATKFLRAIDNRMGVASSLVDVQDRLRIQAGLQQGHSPNLVNAVMQSRYGRGYILSKAWTISGWDNIPLHPDQVEYAALDVMFTFLLGSLTN